MKKKKSTMTAEKIRTTTRVLHVPPIVRENAKFDASDKRKHEFRHILSSVFLRKTKQSRQSFNTKNVFNCSLNIHKNTCPGIVTRREEDTQMYVYTKTYTKLYTARAVHVFNKIWRVVCSSKNVFTQTLILNNNKYKSVGVYFFMTLISLYCLKR